MVKIIFILGFMSLTFSVSAQCSFDSVKLVKMIVMNDNRNRPIADSKEYFWSSEKLNVITFSGDLYYDLIKYRLRKLKKDSLANNFSISAAVLFSWNNNTDTVYADCFFRNWLIHSDTFSVSDDFLKKMFSPLYLGLYLDMRKGDEE